MTDDEIRAELDRIERESWRGQLRAAGLDLHAVLLAELERVLGPAFDRLTRMIERRR